MLKLLKIISTVAIVATLPSLLFPSTPEEATPVVEHFPAIKLMPNWNDAMTYGIASMAGERIVKMQIISEKDFIMIFSGARSHIVNPEGQNLFELNGISPCFVEYDPLDREHEHHCQTIKNLWRLRFQKNPLIAGDQTGWTRLENAPDKAQLLKLQEFGLTRLSDFIVGDDVWSLIRATNDPTWVASYR